MAPTEEEIRQQELAAKERERRCAMLSEICDLALCCEPRGASVFAVLAGVMEC